MAQGFDPEPIWDKEISVPEKWIQSVDDNVYAKLPIGTRIISISPHGSSYWTRTVDIKTEQADGSRVSFFVKVTEGDNGKGMVAGEFVSMTKLRAAVPALVPRPIAWGTFAQDPDIHFFLCEFITMTGDIPDPVNLGKMLSELHHNNVSPNGKYGFEIPTYQGTIPQKVDWQDTWEGFFSSLIERILSIEWGSQGPDEELKDLTEKMMTKVIPRLLRPLETGGRHIEPRLLHGDIWDGNCSIDVDKDLPVIFDATCLYAHNEMEMAPWRPERHLMGKPFFKSYVKCFPKSEPKADFDDRNNLYCMRFNICCSALYPGNLRYRKMVMEDMRYLVGKHGGGYEEWAKENEPEYKETSDEVPEQVEGNLLDKLEQKLATTDHSEHQQDSVEAKSQDIQPASVEHTSQDTQATTENAGTKPTPESNSQDTQPKLDDSSQETQSEVLHNPQDTDSAETVSPAPQRLKPALESDSQYMLARADSSSQTTPSGQVEVAFQDSQPRQASDSFQDVQPMLEDDSQITQPEEKTAHSEKTETASEDTKSDVKEIHAT